MKILLINPFYTSNCSTRWYPPEPLGLLYLRESIRAIYGSKVTVKILDAQTEGGEEIKRTPSGYRNGMVDGEILDFLDSYKPDVVGITNNYTFGAKDAIEIAKLVKHFGNPVVILGGANATMDHERLIKLPWFDYVARGEGEDLFVEFIKRFLDGGVEDILGLTTKNKINPPRTCLVDLSKLPIPRRDEIPFDLYSKYSKYPMCPKQRPTATISSSRGCPFRCTFCSTQAVWGNNWRGMSVERMLKEVSYLYSLGVREVYFYDDQLLRDKLRIEEFCLKSIEYFSDMTYSTPGTSPMLMSEELLELMSLAGFYRLCFSVDVGTAKVAKLVKKPVKLEKVRGLVEKANTLGMWTWGTFVMGFPQETKEDIKEMITYASSLGFDFVNFFMLQLHKGSEIYNNLLRSGVIKDDLHGSNSMDYPLCPSEHLSQQELIALHKEAERTFYKQVARRVFSSSFIKELWPKINTWTKFKYGVKLLWNLIKMKI